MVEFEPWLKRGLRFAFFIHRVLDINKHINDSNDYSCFAAVNPWNYSKEDFEYLDATPYTEIIDNVEQVIAVTCRLDNLDH